MDLFEQVMVERITATRRRDLLRIYIRSERLIEKEQIYSVEKEIKKQFFPREYLIIKIYEKFVLSEQYDPEKLMGLYRESILTEIRECDHTQCSGRQICGSRMKIRWSLFSRTV